MAKIKSTMIKGRVQKYEMTLSGSTMLVTLNLMESLPSEDKELNEVVV